jgi:cytoskeletal protein RodZ
MKRCPQCEFLYEDDQSLCDMDGALLVLDSRTLPNLHALATVPAIPVQARRNRAVPAFATLILALLLGMVYYVSTQRHTYTPPPATSTSLNPAPPLAADNPSPAPVPAAQAAQPAELPKQEETKPAPASKQPTPAAPAKKPAAKTAAAPQITNITAEPKKDDSKVGSILKKTGRILKKPFKF